MSREEAKKFLLEQLKKVPNREVCKCATVEQLNRIFKEIEFDEMADFLIGDNLELKISEIPEDQKFEVVIYFSKLNETEALGDWEIWNLVDNQTKEWYEKVKTEILEWRYDGLYVEWNTLIEYSKSDKPDF